MEDEKENKEEKEIEEKIEEKENEKEEKIEEVPQVSEASISSEGFSVDSTASTAPDSEAVAPVIKSEERKGLESSLQDVQTEKKEKNEEKYVPFHYSSEQNRYATRAENIESFETRQAEQVNTLREVVMPRTVEMPTSDFIPRKDRQVSMVRENMPSQFREDVVKYKKVDKDNGLPESKWHDNKKEVKKYKIQTEF